MKNVRRGYHEEDHQLFSEQTLPLLSSCADDITYLLNRGYPYKSAVTFVGNHYLLTERQRNALMRICVSDEMLKTRKQKQLPSLPEKCTVNIDAFNAVVLMETALSHSMLLLGRDGCCRDLSGLAGTYAVIEKTDPAIEHIIEKLQEQHVSKAVWWIDAPVSNSGRLKAKIADIGEGYPFGLDIRIQKDVDRELYGKELVATSDSIILDHCASWVNLTAECLWEENKKPLQVWE